MDSSRLTFWALTVVSSLFLASAVKAPDTTTTPSDPNPKATWAVNDASTGYNCILANFETNFKIQYTAVNPKTNETYQRNASLTVPQTATVSSKSMCNAGTLVPKSVLALEWKSGAYSYGLQIDFNMTGGMDNRTAVSGIHLQYDLGDGSEFIDAANTSEWQRNADVLGQIATINHGNYLKCDTGFDVELNESFEGKPVWGEMKNVKLEAFRQSKTATFDDAAAVCPGDQVVTSTYAPSTTPKPGDGKTYQLVDAMTNKTCLEAHFNLDLSVLYYATDNKTVINNTINNLNNGTINNVTSYCHENQSLLAIDDLLPKWTLYFFFTHNNDKFALDYVTLNFNLINFDKANYTLPQTSKTQNLQNTWGAHLNKSYMCNVRNEWSLNTTALDGVQAIDLKMENVHVQAFMHNDIFDQAEECSADNGPGDTSQIVPIAVGCALAALVIIVLIAYVIGRRRNRARGYESM